MGNLLGHLLVEVGGHGIAVVVGQVAAIHGNRGTGGRTHADDVDMDAHFGGLLSRSHGIVLKVLAIGDDDDCFLRLLAL